MRASKYILSYFYVGIVLFIQIPNSCSKETVSADDAVQQLLSTCTDLNYSNFDSLVIQNVKPWIILFSQEISKVDHIKWLNVIELFPNKIGCSFLDKNKELDLFNQLKVAAKCQGRFYPIGVGSVKMEGFRDVRTPVEVIPILNSHIPRQIMSVASVEDLKDFIGEAFKSEPEKLPVLFLPEEGSEGLLPELFTRVAVHLHHKYVFRVLQDTSPDTLRALGLQQTVYTYSLPGCLVLVIELADQQLQDGTSDDSLTSAIDDFYGLPFDERKDGPLTFDNLVLFLQRVDHELSRAGSADPHDYGRSVEDMDEDEDDQSYAEEKKESIPDRKLVNKQKTPKEEL